MHATPGLDEFATDRAPRHLVLAAVQMAALQIHAEYGPGLDAEGPDAFSAALERFVTRQVLMTRPKEEWRADVVSRWGVGAHVSVKHQLCWSQLVASAQHASEGRRPETAAPQVWRMPLF